MKNRFNLIITTLALTLTLQACAPVVVTGAAVGTSVAYDRRTTGMVIDDKGIELEAGNLIHQNKAISEQSHINITSYNGIVLITGETPTPELKQQVTAEIQKIQNIRNLYNELVIAAPSTLSSRSTDTWITSKVKSKMTVEEGSLYQVKVVTERGVVYLMGLVTDGEAAKSVDIARTTGGVQRVVKIFEYIEAKPTTN